MNGTRDAVCDLQVHFRNHIFLVDTSIPNISDSCTLDHVTDSEPLDGLILGDTSGAVGATDGVGVAAVVLVTAVISSLLSHDSRCVVQSVCP